MTRRDPEPRPAPPRPAPPELLFVRLAEASGSGAERRGWVLISSTCQRAACRPPPAARPADRTDSMQTDRTAQRARPNRNDGYGIESAGASEAAGAPLPPGFPLSYKGFSSYYKLKYFVTPQSILVL